MTGLLVARNSIKGYNVREEGLRGLPGQLVLYASEETHNCVQKGVEMMGLGKNAMRKIRVDAEYRMDVKHLKQCIKEDLAAGHIPFCVVANVGTVNTGAIDPLKKIKKICQKHKLWLHIDGAFGALAKLVPEYQKALKVMETADSIALDLHKWMYMPYEVGCVFIRDKDLHRKAFATQPNYLLKHERGLAAGPDGFGNYGMELSRGFKALKVWMSFKEHGIEKFARLIRQNIAQAFYLESLVHKERYLEMVTPVRLNLVCFRFCPSKNADSLDLDTINKEIVMQLQEKGIAAPSSTILDGKYAIRVANVNHRSSKKDFEVLAKSVVELELGML